MQGCFTRTYNLYTWVIRDNNMKPLRSQDNNLRPLRGSCTFLPDQNLQTTWFLSKQDQHFLWQTWFWSKQDQDFQTSLWFLDFDERIHTISCPKNSKNLFVVHPERNGRRTVACFYIYSGHRPLSRKKNISTILFTTIFTAQRHCLHCCKIYSW